MIIDAEIEKLISKGVIEPASHEEGEILSNIFIRPKTDGTHRMILNLKEFNKFVTYHHFKIDTIHTITKLMSKDCYMASIDLKDAYYSIPVEIFAIYLQWATLSVHLLIKWLIQLPQKIHQNSQAASDNAAQKRSHFLGLY